MRPVRPDQVSMARLSQNKGPEWLYLLPEPSCNEFHIIDVGAYKGDFTASVLFALPNAKAWLFEPTDEKYRQLLKRFHDFSGVKVFNIALSSREGSQEFFQTEDAATNSLLEPCSTQSQFNISRVAIRRLDNFLEQEAIHDPIDLLKLDAQGNDFRILQGAARTIQEYHPLIMVECIFVPIYKEQDSYYDILGFMQGNGLPAGRNLQQSRHAFRRSGVCGPVVRSCFENSVGPGCV
jgi:FkbM family methyltransferase